jgi:hypothetical protein
VPAHQNSVVIADSQKTCIEKAMLVHPKTDPVLRVIAAQIDVGLNVRGL